MNRHLSHQRVPSASRQHRVPATERGAALVEYVLVFSLIVLVCLASVTTFGGGVNDSVTDSSNRVVAVSP